MLPGFPKHFVDSSRFPWRPRLPLPPSANSEKEMAKHIASELEISETETTYVESQNTETSLGSSEDKRSGRSSILSTVVILLVELCERLTYYTLGRHTESLPSKSVGSKSIYICGHEFCLQHLGLFFQSTF